MAPSFFSLAPPAAALLPLGKASASTQTPLAVQCWSARSDQWRITEPRACRSYLNLIADQLSWAPLHVRCAIDQDTHAVVACTPRRTSNKSRLSEAQVRA